MTYYNSKWTADVLEMRLNKEKGPDIIDDGKFLELKFSLVNPKESKRKNNKKDYPKSWTVLEDQIDYKKKQQLKKGYWGLGFYELTKAIIDINTTDLNNLEDLVLFRDLYIVKLDWMIQFPSSYTHGRTSISEWNNTFRYPKYNKLPEIIKTYEVNKGEVHLTKGVNLNNFDLGNTEILVEGVPF